MGKRSDFERKPRDLYETPPEAVQPLLHHLCPQTRFIEPCAGAGALVDALQAAGHLCVGATDIEPLRADIGKQDAFGWGSIGAEYNSLSIITNPPWQRPFLHRFLAHFIQIHPTWALFDADWAHTVQSHVAKLHNVPTVPELFIHCRKVVNVGRVKWEPGSAHKGKDNCSWYLFTRETEPRTTLYERTGE